MTDVEQRLADAFAHADRLEPSPDLWSRVVHSIEEDRLHRKRLPRTAITAGAVLAAPVVVALGPAVRRFGRGYASDLFTTSRSTARAMLRLLDLAYFLIFGGYILLTVNSTRTGSRVPRWIWILLIVGGIVAWQLAGIPVAVVGGH